MLKRMFALALALSFVGSLALAHHAEARRCPAGQEDVNNQCK